MGYLSTAQQEHQGHTYNLPLHFGIDPYDYLVDVLQRLGQHPAADVHLLTPRLWKTHFAANPLRSDLYNIGK